MASDVEQISCTEYAEQARKRKIKKVPRKKRRIIEIVDSEDDDDVVMVPESERPPPPKATVSAHISPIFLDDDDDECVETSPQSPVTCAMPEPIPLIQNQEESVSHNKNHSDGLQDIKIVSFESLLEEEVHNFSCRACNLTIAFKSTWEFHLKSLSHRRNVELLASQASPTPTMLVRNTSTPPTPRIQQMPAQPSLPNVQLTNVQPIHLPIVVEQDPADDTSSGVGDSRANSVVLDEPASESTAACVVSDDSSKADGDDSTSSVSDNEDEFLVNGVRSKRRGSFSDSLSDTSGFRPKRRCAEAAQNRIKDLAFLSRLGSKQLTNYHRMMEKTLNGEDPSTVGSDSHSASNTPPITVQVKKEKPFRAVQLGVQTISDDESCILGF
ncbi:hypothetical protein CAPTEDRAFT_196454 [Capitella teleta]|uniref:C2H2-type domain-containing protein n=1 Tax=Capitella teleta TaxID=283909 RepID=R7V0S5_CAPTE|nr:hypothetical protein CAPTEDRAFT_196454 [Capitella teleta]|eukprot:ELU12443.1 hypothetical protein CAPTEDRAFT_196454 [Capitella teleta]